MKCKPIERVLFIRSEQPSTGRGWPAGDAKQVVAELGFEVNEYAVTTRSELESVIASHDNFLVWPVTYAIGDRVDGPLITGILEDLGLPYIGPTAANLKLSSKLRFKTALQSRTPYLTPLFEILDADTSSNEQIGFPAILKTEYSSNSRGVLAVADESACQQGFKTLFDSFHQSIFIERWEREKEYTTAYLPPMGPLDGITASLQLSPTSNKNYIDKEAKQFNHLIEFAKPNDDTLSRLDYMTRNIVRSLEIDGYCRLDFVENSDGLMFVIEGNFLPYLTREASAQSYFPMAFERIGLSYPEIIGRIIAHALWRCDGKTSFRFVEKYTG
jgi:D-alanine-D-alanine ligase-like ATP-grasp enzyme